MECWYKTTWSWMAQPSSLACLNTAHTDRVRLCCKTTATWSASVTSGFANCKAGTAGTKKAVAPFSSATAFLVVGIINSSRHRRYRTGCVLALFVAFVMHGSYSPARRVVHILERLIPCKRFWRAARHRFDRRNGHCGSV